MNNVLKKRLLRDLKSNFAKYLSLLLLIIMGMYLVISIVGAAETIMTRTQEYSDKNQVEDGHFSTFIPLTDNQQEEIKDSGYTIEELFSIDMTAEDESTLRMMRVRDSINLIELDSGVLPKDDYECVIEKRYAEVHGLSVGDVIIASDMEFEIVGIGSTPDYDAPYEQLSDMAVSSNNFGIMFVSDKCYESLKQNETLKAENYCYAYKLNDGNTADDLESMLRDFSFNYEDINDEYYLEIINDMLEPKHEMEDGINELHKGANELSDALNAFNESVGGVSTEINAMNDGAAELSEGIDDLQKQSEELFDEIFKLDIDNLTSFVESEDNIRINAASNDVSIRKTIGLAAGIIVMILFTYVISVFVIHQIQQETSIIGTLYALGAKKKDLIIHYITLPSITAFIGGTIGTVLGFSSFGVRLQMQQTYSYFSLPDFETVYPAYLIIYGLVMPIVVAIIVNAVVINKKLSGTALSLIRNEQKNSQKHINIKKGSFVYRFQIRQILREFRSSATVVFGMFVAMLVIMLGLNSFVLCGNVERNTERDVKYEYMYTLKYPMDEVPDNGEASYVKKLSMEAYGCTLDISVMGIEEASPYFPDIHVQEGKNKIVISSAVSSKYNLKKGDKLILSDKANDMDYAFTIQDIGEYEVGLAVFMNIDSMRELFNQEDDYHNCILSESKLNIEEGILYDTVTREEIVESTGVFKRLMKPLIMTFIAVGIIIYLAIMYLMQGVMIDRASTGISLLKTFGYRKKEINKLYLNGNFYTIIIGTVISIPLAKKVMNMIFPYFTARNSCGIQIAFPWYLYAIIGIVVLIAYFVIQSLLMRKLNKITPAEILRNRE